MIAATLSILVWPVLATVILWALSRRNVQAKCQVCGYLIHDTANEVYLCPECGSDAAARTRRRRRRRIATVIALSGMVAVGESLTIGLLWPDQLVRGMPAWLLVRTSPLLTREEVHGFGAMLRNELRHRYREGTLTDAHAGTLFERRLREMMRGRAILYTRDRWPEDVPIRALAPVPIGMRSPVPATVVLQFSNGDRVVLELCPGPRSPLTMGSFLGPGVPWRDPTIHVPAEALDGNELVASVMVIRGMFRSETELPKDAVVLAEVKGRQQLTFVPTVFDAVEAVEDDQYAKILEEGFRCWLGPQGRVAGTPPYLLAVAMPEQMWLPGLTLALTTELLNGDDVLWSTEMWFSSMHRLQMYNFSLPEDVREALREWSSMDLRLRLTGNPMIALREFETEQFWSGSVCVPVQVIDR